MSLFIAHITSYAPDGTPDTLYVSDEPVAPLPHDDPDAPNRIYLPILIEAANIRRDLFGDVTQGGGERGYGIMRLSNADKSLQTYRQYSFGAIDIYRYVPGTPLNQAIHIFAGRASKAGWGHATKSSASLTLNVRDDFQILETNIQTTKYAGTASGGNVLDGEEGLTGQVLPLSFGDLSEAHAPGILVSPGQQIWQVNDSAIDSFDVIYDRGDDAGYVLDSDLDEAGFLAATPVMTEYVTHKAKGLIKLGGSPVGQVAFGLTVNTDDTPRAIIKALLLQAGIASSDISADFDVAGGPKIGLHLTGETTLANVIRYAARAEAAAVMPDSAGVWRYDPVKVPDAAADYDLPYDDILDLSSDGDQTSPVWRVKVGYGRNHKTLSRGDLAPAVRGTANEALMTTEWRYAEASSQATLDRFPSALEKDVQTPLRLAADAQSLADSLLSVLGPQAGGGARERLRLVLPFDDARAALRLGSSVRVYYPDADIDRNFILAGVELTRPKRHQMIWRVWG